MKQLLKWAKIMTIQQAIVRLRIFQRSLQVNCSRFEQTN